MQISIGKKRLTALSAPLCSSRAAILRSLNIPLVASFSVNNSWFRDCVKMSTSCCKCVRSCRTCSSCTRLLFLISVLSSEHAAEKRYVSYISFVTLVTGISHGVEYTQGNCILTFSTSLLLTRLCCATSKCFASNLRIAFIEVTAWSRVYPPASSRFTIE